MTDAVTPGAASAARRPCMRVDVVSIFPDYLAPLDLSLIGKAREDGLLDVRVHDLRDFTHDRHRTVDDTPYGGGAGMVMKPQPWSEALDHVLAHENPSGAKPHLIVPGPGGCVIPLLPNPPAWHVWKCVDGGWVLRRICTTTLPSPDPSYTCVDGLWEPPVAPSCTTVKPGPDWVCVKGDWLPPRVPEDDEDTGEALSGFAAPHVIAARDDAAYWHGPPAVAEFLAHEE